MSETRTADFASNWELAAIFAYLKPVILRGKGLTQTQARVDQFAY
ncbi:MAG: hypothetical protein AAGI24_13555 [Pseudomonadota bacterium]